MVTSYKSVTKDTQKGSDHQCYLQDSREILDSGWGDGFLFLWLALFLEVGIRILLH